MNENQKGEFYYDEKITKNKKMIENHENGACLLTDQELAHAGIEIETATNNLRAVQCEAHGWREVERLYGDKSTGKADFLRTRIIEIEGQIAEFEKTLSGYDVAVKDQEALISQLQNKRAGNIGDIPSLDSIREAQEKLLDIHKRAGIAEAGLPEVQSDLEKAKAELQALEKKNQAYSSFTGDKYPSPSAEVDGKARKYMRDNDIDDYGEAVIAILRQDNILAEAYEGRAE